MFAFIVRVLRQLLLPVAILVYLSDGGSLAHAAPETPADQSADGPTPSTVSKEEPTPGLKFNLQAADFRLHETPIIITEARTPIPNLGTTLPSSVAKLGLIWGPFGVTGGSGPDLVLSRLEGEFKAKTTIEIGLITWDTHHRYYTGSGCVYLEMPGSKTRARSPATFKIYIETDHPWQGAFSRIEMDYETWTVDAQTHLEIGGTRKREQAAFRRTFTTVEYHGVWREANLLFNGSADRIRLLCDTLDRLAVDANEHDAEQMRAESKQIRDFLSLSGQLYVDAGRVLMLGGKMEFGPLKGQHIDKPDPMAAPPKELASLLDALYASSIERMPKVVGKVGEMVDAWKEKAANSKKP